MAVFFAPAAPTDIVQISASFTSALTVTLEAGIVLFSILASTSLSISFQANAAPNPDAFKLIPSAPAIEKIEASFSATTETAPVLTVSVVPSILASTVLSMTLIDTVPAAALPFAPAPSETVIATMLLLFSDLIEISPPTFTVEDSATASVRVVTSL